ncbi:MAG: site-2 protease family protein [Clostridia bacterium]|nr:site-2 protease family protein [Clostridia bacterium]
MTERIRKTLGASLTFGKVRLHLSALVLAAFFFVGGNGEVFLALVLSAALHEVGHFIAMRAFGLRAARIDITALGAAICLSGMSGYRRDIAVAAAGPAASALAFATSFAAYAHGGHGAFLSLFCGVNLIICVLNLVPVPPLDGGVILSSALYLKYDAAHAGELTFYISLASAVTLFVLGGLLFYYTGSNVSLMLIALFLLFCVTRLEKLV